MTTGPPLEVKVWGRFACFTRPEMKVERVTYTVMTPSAARGALEAIFWKPEFEWQVREIWVLKELRYFSILRNEVNNIATLERARSGYFADDDRAQRHTLALRDVAYVIKADVSLRPHAQGEDPAKFRDQFRRRVATGACHHTPYLGCREFAASFGPPQPTDSPIPVDLDLGLMLFDLEYAPDGSRAMPRFFDARLAGGVLRVPQSLYEGQEAEDASG
jgi:CRISPR-associated protein Cas5d